MAFVAKYFSREYLSKQIATLAKALESVSTNLSIIALLGLALIVNAWRADRVTTRSGLVRRAGRG